MAGAASALQDFGGNSCSINLAIQVLLHCPQLKKIIREDESHAYCNKGRECWTCDMWNVFVSVVEKKMGDKLPLNTNLPIITKYNNLSSRINPTLRDDPFEIICILLSKLRLEFVERAHTIDRVTSTLFHAAPISLLFEVHVDSEVDCGKCGIVPRRVFLLGVPVPSLEGDLSVTLDTTLSGDTVGACHKCSSQGCVISNSVTAYPPILLVHCKSNCSPAQTVTPSLILHGDNYSIQSCIVTGKNKKDFYGVVSGGQRVYLIDHAKVVTLKLGNFLLGTFMANCKATLVYARDTVPIVERCPDMNVKKQPIKRSAQYKVTSHPHPDVDLTSNMPTFSPKPRFRHFGTQSTVKIKDVSTQANIKEPIVTYKKCKSFKKFKFFTGLSVEQFEALHDFIGGEEVITKLKMMYNERTPKKYRKTKIPSRDRLLLFLLRLRRGFPLEDLAVAFSVSVGYAGELFYVMTRLIFLSFKALEDACFVSAKRQAKKKPSVMRAFKNLRVILDGASFFIETPSDFQQQGNCFSQYKAHDVLLHILGCSCHGSTIFCSPSFEGSMSDKEAVLKSKLFEKLSAMDSIMTDRGFDLTAECNAHSVHQYKPPSKGHNRSSLTAEEEVMTQAIAAARIYIEHVVADVKDWRLLRGVAPYKLLPIHGQLVFIAAYLRNFEEKKIRTKRPFVERSEEAAGKSADADGNAKEATEDRGHSPWDVSS